MFFIGIISEEKNEKYIKEMLKHNINNSNVIFINEKDIDNIKNVKFKIIVLNKELINKNLEIDDTDLDGEKVILNSDINVKLVENLNLKVITYGFNSKATVTASSITEEEMLVCIQRNIVDMYNNKFEPQEINIEKNELLDIYDNMYIMCINSIWKILKKM